MQNTIQIESAAVSDRGLSDKRPQNEDSYLELPERGVFAVADGVGGAQAGDVASQMAVEILGEAFTNQLNGDAEAVMRLALERANAAIFQMASDLPQLAAMATTIVAVHLAGDVATIGHVGDSRLYRIDKSGNIFRETNDHSVVEEEVRAGRLTPVEAINHPNRNIISRALGAEGTVDIDLKTIIAEPGTRFLLCSDGITRHIEDFELREIFQSIRSPEDICYRLKEICYDRGAEDNLTALVISVGGAGETVTAGGIGAGDGAEDEEVTVATARSPFDDTVSNEEFPITSATASGSPAAREAMAGPRDDDSFLMIEPEAAEIQPPADESSRERAAAPVSASESSRPAAVSSAQQKFHLDQKHPGTASRILSSIAFLLLGGLLGAGAFYMLQPASPAPVVDVPPPPAITEMKSNNTALTSFEEARRQVDNDPTKYLAAKAASPQEAEDYFLLGRAFLLTGRYWEAKRAFNEAKNRLPQVDAGNAKTLSAEIAMALAIIESPAATDSFSRNMAATVPAADSNTNTTPDSVPTSR